jgi:hypothetical protein
VEFQREAAEEVVVRKSEEVGTLGGACVVHQDVEPAKRGDRSGDGLRGGVRFAEVGGVDGGADGVGRQAGGDVLQFGAVARDEADVDALTREFGGDGGADASVAAGDQRGLAAEPEFHRRAPPRLVAADDGGDGGGGQTGCLWRGGVAARLRCW